MIGKRPMIAMLARGYNKIIDIGCGADPVMQNTTNVDKTPIEYFQSKFKDKTFTIPNFKCADAYALPFENKQFDCAILSEVIEHAERPIDMLTEARRIANIIILSAPNEHEWDFRHKPFTHPDHNTRYTEEGLKNHIKQAGLELLEFYKLNYDGWSFFIVECAGEETMGNIHRIQLPEENRVMIR